MSDYYNHRAQKFDNNGNFLRKYTSDYASGIGVVLMVMFMLVRDLITGLQNITQMVERSHALALVMLLMEYQMHNDIVHVVTMWQAIQQ